MGIAVILVVLALLMALAFRGISILLLAPVLAAVAAALAGLPVLASYTQLFMVRTGGFIITYFPLFLLGAIFGKLMETSGAARSIGDWSVARLGQGRAILAIILSCGILTYGGVSLFVVAFAVYPLAAAIFSRADIPARLVPGTIALGAFTFTMTALPGTPAIQNAIPMPYFGTTAFAAPGLGILAAVIMLGVGYGWMAWRASTARRHGEGYAASLAEGHAERAMADADAPKLAFGLALAPIVLVVVLNLILSKYVFPSMDLSYLALPEWGEVQPKDVIGVWSITVSLVLASLSVFAINPRLAGALIPSLSDGANASVVPIFNTASLVGFGAVIAALPAFAVLRDSILSVAPGNPLISLSIAVNILAGITGSASGGMSIALEALGPHYLDLGNAAGIDPAVLHRVTAVATGGLDALPHNGAVVTLLAICGMSHAKSYLDIFVVALLGPVLALIAIVAVASM
ncbi:GntP family permease [Chachezhania sediminis]|uniref:GntP family permease n=1 Tax=Chachezhania sediminis TaxID=2599291 RepID=UPI00131E6276|nr:GntP family permease [Chachezhania sediminis]